VLAVQLVLVALAVAAASWASRRGGHAVAGLITGLPVIVAPLMALLLLDQPAARVQAIAWATLACLPATLLHGLCFAWLAPLRSWPNCLALATAAYALAAWALQQAVLPPAVVAGLALLAPWAAARAMPGREPPSAVAPVLPAREIVWRVLAAVALAAAVMVGAGSLPTAVSGALVALPIAGAVLPCFALSLHGPAAARRLLRGFARGLLGFALFMLVMALGLGHAPPAVVWTAAVLLAWVSSPFGRPARWRRNRRPAPAAGAPPAR
jgi:hypothetical protein